MPEDKHADSIVTLKHEGVLNVATSPTLKARLNEVAASGAKHIVVDLSDVAFIDSSGLGTLVAGLKAATTRGGMLALVGMQEQAATVFRITQADKLFPIFASEREARDYFTAHTA